MKGKKMNHILRSTVFLTLFALAAAPPALGQTKVPRDKIPAAAPLRIRKLIEGLYSTLPAERVAAAIGLGKLGEDAAPAIPFLIGILGDSEPVTMKASPEGSPNVVLESRTRPCIEAANALGRIGKPAIEPLLEAVKSPNDDAVIVWGITALGTIGQPAVDALLPLTQDTNEEVRTRAVQAIGAIDDPRAVKALAAALKDPSSYVREKAVDGLLASQAKDVAVIEALIGAVGDKSGYIRRQANEALRKKTGTGRDLYSQTQWQSWWSENKDKYASSLESK